MRILVTNDDGIDAEGIASLVRALEPLGEVRVVAPHAPVSGCGHQVTTHRPLKLARRDERYHAVDGTPADCARVGLLHVWPEADWVVSGINHGGNLGADVYTSGTVAAAREAALWGRQAIAISQYVSQHPVDWEQTARWSREVLAELLARPLPPGRFWNVNLPHPAEPVAAAPQRVFCPLDVSPLPVVFHLGEDETLHYRGVYRDRPRQADCDVGVCFSGQIAISELSLS